MMEKNNTKLIKKPNFDLIKYYLNRFKNANEDFFIVTNDKDLLIKNKLVTSNHMLFSANELDDFKKLIECDQMYASQSTFCFWAFFLARKLNNCKLVNKKNWIFKDLI